MPAVLLQLIRQTQARALLGVQAPTNTRTFNPAMQRRKVTLFDAKPCAQCRDVQQIKDFTDRESTVRDLQQVFDCNQQRFTAALALVGQGERNEASIITLKLAEHGTNVRGVAIDVGDHDDHIAWAQIRVSAETGE